MEWEEITRDSIYKISSDKKVRKVFERVKNSKRLANSLKSFPADYKDWFGSKPTEKLYNAIFCITEYPKCECGKDLTFISFQKGYRKFCSGKCSQNNKEVRQKIEDTLFTNYGTRDSLEIKDGRKRGIAYITSEENFRKQQINNEKKFGGKTSFSSPEVQDKCKETIYKKFGVENIMYNKKFIDNKFIPILNTKRKETYIEKYGETHPMKNNKVKSKVEESNLLKFGVKWPAQNVEVRSKIRLTNEKNCYWITEDRVNDFKSYRKLVWRYTNNNNLSVLENIDKRAHTKEGYHLDHKYSIYQGFIDGIDAKIIGNICNLEMLQSGQNLSKNRKCSITKEDLLSSYAVNKK